MGRRDTVTDVDGTERLAAVRARRTSAPPPGRDPVVRVSLEGRTMVELPVDRTRVYTIGRASWADIRVDDPAVSRIHATLRHTGDGEWTYTDAGSTNGSLRFLPEDLRTEDTSYDVEHARAFVLALGETVGVGSPRVVLSLVSPERSRGNARPAPGIQVSAASRALEQEIARAATTTAPVMLMGPSGTGKTHTAAVLHERSRRKGRFVAVNAGSLPTDPTELTARLLGFVRGGYTGALRDEEGLWFAANGGTLFLDEVESLSSAAQAYLLDVLEGNGDYAQLGSNRKRSPPDVRLVSASKRPLAQSPLREDLVYRLLAGHIIRVPTLEERKADIPGFLALFAHGACERAGMKCAVEFADDAVEVAREGPWPGQVRQLQATVEQAVSTALRGARDGDRVTIHAHQMRTPMDRYRDALGGQESATEEMDARAVRAALRKRPRQLTREDVEAALRDAKGNKAQAARALDVALNTLKDKMRRFGIS